MLYVGIDKRFYDRINKAIKKQFNKMAYDYSRDVTGQHTSSVVLNKLLKGA